jgi:hypothetical protein
LARDRDRESRPRIATEDRDRTDVERVGGRSTARPRSTALDRARTLERHLDVVKPYVGLASFYF